MIGRYRIDRVVIYSTPLLSIIVSCNLASAQLFGARSFGSPLQRQSRPQGLGSAGLDDSSAAAGAEAGAITGNERFLRGNRRANDFVGSDQAEANRFVGAGQVLQGGRVQSSVESLQGPQDAAAQLNQPFQPPPPGQPYPPRIEIAFEVPGPQRFWENTTRSPSTALAGPADPDRAPGVSQNFENIQPTLPLIPAALSGESLALTQRAKRSGITQVQVVLQGRTAILRGQAGSEQEKQLTELLIGFEPGISTVQNEISVVER